MTNGSPSTNSTISTETDALLQNPKGSNNHDVEAVSSLEDDEEAYQKAKSRPPPLEEQPSVFSDVKSAFKDHLEEAMEGEDFFLTMSLTKNLSLLPSKPELNQAVEEVQQEFEAMVGNPQEPTDDYDDDWDPNTPPPLKAYLILGSAVVALSSIGPCLAKQVDCDPCMKIVWRFQGTVVMLSPLAIHSIIADGIPRLTHQQWITFLMAAASYSVLCVAFAMAVDYTTVSNALILTNSQSVLLVLAKLLVGKDVIFLEGSGVAVAFLGGVLAAREAAQAEDSPAQGWWSIYGDFLGIVSSIGGIGYIVLGKSLRAHFPVLMFMVMNMLTASFIIIAWMYVLGREVSWDMDYNHGVFGWMLPTFQRLPLEIITVVVCNVFGTLGYVRAFKYFSSVIIAVAALLEPVVGAFTATAWDVGVLPGVEGWIGNFLVIMGTIAVLYPTTPQYAAEQERKRMLTEAKFATPRRSPYPRMKSPRLTPNRGDRRNQIHDSEVLISPTGNANSSTAAKRRLQNLKCAAYGKNRQQSLS